MAGSGILLGRRPSQASVSERSTGFVPAVKSALFDFGLRGLIMLAVLVPWYLLDWGWAVKLTAFSTATALSPFCESVMSPDGTRVLCNGHAFVFAKECTYLDLFLASAPFVWRPGRREAVNLRRLAVVLSLIVVLNLVRLVGGLAAYVNGLGWKLAHDVPDMFLYWPVLGFVIIAYWRSVTWTGNSAPEVSSVP